MSLATETRALAKLAWPLLVAQLTQMLMTVSDTIMAGRVSSTDMAAVAIAASVLLPILIFVQGLIMALPPIIARLNGACKLGDIPKTGQQGFWLAVIITLPIAFSSQYAHSLMALIPMAAELRDIAAEYLQYMLIAMPAFAIYQVFRQYLEGLSKTKPTMIIMLVGLMVNIPANYVFIYGKLGVPAYGGAGCGLASALVFTMMMLCSWGYIRFSAAVKSTPFFHDIQLPDFRQIGIIIALGLPIALSLLFEVSLFAAVAILLAPLGADVVASHQIALNVSGVLFMVPLSIGFATTIRIGFLLGEDKPEMAKLAVKSALLLGFALAAVNAAISIFLGKPIAGLYNNEPLVVALAAHLLIFAAVFQFSDAAQVITGCALRGYKDTKAMFYITLATYWGVGLSTGYTLALTDWVLPRMGAAGFWVGFILGLTCAALALGTRLLIIQKRQRITAHLATPNVTA